MRYVIATLLLVAACHETIDHELTPDSGLDEFDGSGSGSAMASELDPSPRDYDLELVVVGASLVVVIGPIRDVRRRRRALKDAIQNKPPFS